MNNLERNCEGLTTKLLSRNERNYAHYIFLILVSLCEDQVTSCFVPEHIIKLVIVGHQTMWHTRSVYLFAPSFKCT